METWVEDGTTVLESNTACVLSFLLDTSLCKLRLLDSWTKTVIGLHCVSHMSNVSERQSNSSLVFRELAELAR